MRPASPDRGVGIEGHREIGIVASAGGSRRLIYIVTSIAEHRSRVLRARLLSSALRRDVTRINKNPRETFRNTFTLRAIVRMRKKQRGQRRLKRDSCTGTAARRTRSPCRRSEHHQRSFSWKIAAFFSPLAHHLEMTRQHAGRTDERVAGCPLHHRTDHGRLLAVSRYASRNALACRLARHTCRSRRYNKHYSGDLIDGALVYGRARPTLRRVIREMIAAMVMDR